LVLARTLVLPRAALSVPTAGPADIVVAAAAAPVAAVDVDVAEISSRRYRPTTGMSY
jgi:hypothetical protein